MITFLTGENSFEIERAIGVIAADFNGRPEKINATNLELSQLPDILMGGSLFQASRLIIIRELSANRDIWPVFGYWAKKISPDIHLVLIESKPDKRTVTYKTLKTLCEVQEYQPFGERDVLMAEKWVRDESVRFNLKLDNQCISEIVRRVGHDQWQLFYAIEKLSLLDNVTIQTVQDVIQPNQVENVFNLFETALRGDRIGLKKMLVTLQATEDVYKISALLASQAFQLAAIVSAENTDNVAKDFGIHPYVVSKLEPIARRVGGVGVQKIIDIFTSTDLNLKASKNEPWTLVEGSLMNVANLQVI